MGAKLIWVMVNFMFSAHTVPPLFLYFEPVPVWIHGVSHRCLASLNFLWSSLQDLKVIIRYRL